MLSRKTIRSIHKMLHSSLRARQMEKIAQSADSGFDLNALSGFDSSLEVPALVAADCVLAYFRNDKNLLHFLSRLFQEEGRAVAGRTVELKEKSRVLNLLKNHNWVFRAELGLFVYDQTNTKTPDWGYLIAGEEYRFFLASIDVVGSSSMADQEKGEAIAQTLYKFRKFVNRYIYIWNGRVWRWSGDGALVAFHGSDAAQNAVMSMVAVNKSLPVFNLKHSNLDERPIEARIGMHFGTVKYQTNVHDIHSEDVQIAADVERYTPDGGICISAAMHKQLNNHMHKFFEPHASDGPHSILRFKGI